MQLLSEEVFLPELPDIAFKKVMTLGHDAEDVVDAAQNELGFHPPKMDI
jgi:hypothetical protein